MAKSFKDFALASEALTDKDTAINNFIGYALNKLQSMFTYTGLPDTIPQKWLEYYLMSNGNCFITKYKGNLYALIGGTGGEYDEYYQPTRYVGSNSYLKYSFDLRIDKDGVLMRNDTLMLGMKPIIQKYGSLLTEAEITMRIALINLRMTNVISAPDDNTKKSADEYINQITNGKLAIIGENPFFDGVKMQVGHNNTGYLQQIIEATQYIKASFYNELGLNANYNLKREYISDTENSLADDILLPLVDNMLSERKDAIEKINKMYNTNITVEFNSSWKTNNKENEKEVATADNVINGTDDNTTDTGTDDNNTDTSTDDNTNDTGTDDNTTNIIDNGGDNNDTE